MVGGGGGKGLFRSIEITTRLELTWVIRRNIEKRQKTKEEKSLGHRSNVNTKALKKKKRMDKTMTRGLGIALRSLFA
jgi:hypothetical protein